ncbi:MAG TPA: hypothetical protein VF017_00295 [Thermoanaerobaculia bacterium]|nr:hypothetical protein [Thermoanaerobaculia bacterium]
MTPPPHLQGRVNLFILAHAATWDGRFQVSSLAASAAAAGQRVEIALFFAALASWVEERWDDLDPASPLTRARLIAAQAPSLAAMLTPGREAGAIRLFACSASVRYLGLDAARVQAQVDAILGWQSFADKIARADRTVTL